MAAEAFREEDSRRDGGESGYYGSIWLIHSHIRALYHEEDASRPAARRVRGVLGTRARSLRPSSASWAWGFRRLNVYVYVREASWPFSCSPGSLTFHFVSFVPFDARKINYEHVASSVYLTACNRMYATKCIARVISSGRADAALIN